MIDYQKIIEELEDDKIIQLMTELGADRYKDTDKAIIFPTICHNIDGSEASMKLYYYKDSHNFYCYTEDGAMSIFRFLRYYYEARQIEFDWYNDILQVVLSCSAANQVLNTNSYIYKSHRDNYSEQKLRRDLPYYSDGILDIFTHYYPIEWLNENISKAAMDKYNIRFSTPQNKIIIPHYDINNHLVGIRGRALNQDEVETLGKYMPIQIENKWYSHPLSLNLYGLNMNWQNIKKYGIAFVAESEKSVLMCESFSMPNCMVASCGSNFNKYQLDLLMRYGAPREVVICYDREEKQGEDKYFNKLYEICKRYSRYTQMSFIYDRAGISKMKDSPCDNGQIIFEQLLKGRVRVK